MNQPIHPVVPEFAILGHPNEGKSSLVSTLSEDDTVKISPYPGETTECRVFPVIIDGREIVRFSDTPGFQVPQKTLAWFERCPLQGVHKVKSFIEENKNAPLFKDECELMKPLARSAIIIFVVDGSRPLRINDRAEMAILKQTELPRMAVINNKSETPDFTEIWTNELSRHFDKVIVFNSHKASYLSRIHLLSELRFIRGHDNDSLAQVIEAFKKEWNRRNSLTAGLILDLLDKALNHSVKGKITDSSRKETEKKRLQNLWASNIKAMEKEAHQNIRALFKHNIFHVDLPDQSLASIDLFDRETWKVLGLSRTELAASAATIGAAAAATIDLALAGHSLGLFAALGGAVGVGSALLGAKRIGKVRVLGKHLGSYTLKAGPNRNLQFMMVLLDRSLIFYSHIINWAHGRRSAGNESGYKISKDHPGIVSTLGHTATKDCIVYFSSLGIKDMAKMESARQKALVSIMEILQKISEKGHESI